MRPDNHPEHAKVVARTAMDAIKRLDAATSRREVVAAHADWCAWADRNRVARQIREHMNLKAAELRTRLAAPAPRDHKMASAGDA